MPAAPPGTRLGSRSITGCSPKRLQNRGEEKSDGEREGGGMQEMRTRCQLGSCVCCLEAAANHSLQLK